MNRFVVHLFMNTLTLFVFLGGLYLIYLQNFDGKYVHIPLTFQTDIMNLETDKKTYDEGDTIYIKTSYCKNYDYIGVTSWSIDDSISRPFPAKTYNLPVGCKVDQWVPILQVPNDAPFIGHEDYYLDGVTAITVNPLHQVFYHLKTKPFKIIPNIRTI